MGLIELPSARLTDGDVGAALGRAVRLDNLILDLLSGVDPFGLRERTHHRGGADNAGDKALDLLASLLDWADVPGTQSWDRKDRAARINWWVRRVGALDTVLVAFPGAFGAVADRLPIQAAFGFGNQGIVLCAVAREFGITDQQTQVRLLAAVLCHRDLTDDVDSTDDSGPATPLEPTTESTGGSVVQKLWHTAGIMRAVAGELDKRPQPRSIFRYFGMLPGIGAVADYLGEYGALVRATKAGERWIAEHPDVVAEPTAPKPGCSPPAWDR